MPLEMKIDTVTHFKALGCSKDISGAKRHSRTSLLIHCKVPSFYYIKQQIVAVKYLFEPVYVRIRLINKEVNFYWLSTAL